MTWPSLNDRLELARVWPGAPLAGLDAHYAGEFDEALLAYLRGRSTPRFFFDHKRAPELGAGIAAGRPAQTQWVIDRAAHALQHRFAAADEEHDAYAVQLPDDIDWYHNPTIEPQFIFTLNRHRFWPELAMATLFTGEARYIEELQRQIVSWCRQSPPLHNPDDWQKFPQSWWLLDAAVRADTWVWAYFLALDSPAWRPEINTLFVHRLWAHARLLRHLTPRTGTYWAPNWLIMQAQGLLNIAVMFPEFDEAAEWQEHAAAVLGLCAESQFFADGGHCEQSPIYHEYCLRWLAEPLYLARLNGLQGSEAAWAIIEKASEFHYQMIMPDGSLPVLSDGDRTSAGILTQMGLFFDHPEWMRYREPSARDCWFMGGVVPTTQAQPTDRPLAVALADAGYTIMRSGDTPDSLQLVFDCGTHGGGHGHYDLLNFELDGYGRVLIADPGRLVYDVSPDRLWVISTPAHNTISLDGKNHDALERPEAARIHLARWEVQSTHILVSGWHEGYASLEGDPLVGRTIWFDRKSTFVVVDWLASAAEHEATVSFTLSGAAETLPGGGARTLWPRGNVVVTPMLAPGQSANLTEAFYSPNYGTRLRAARLTISQKARKAVFVSIVQAFEEVAPEAEVVPEAGPAAWAVRIENDKVFVSGGAENRAEFCLEAPFAAVLPSA